MPYLEKLKGRVISMVSLCPAGPQISHLLFADDNLVFCRAFVSECIKIQSILYSYEQASGQSINRGKANIFFSTNCHDPNLYFKVYCMTGMLISSLPQY